MEETFNFNRPILCYHDAMANTLLELVKAGALDDIEVDEEALVKPKPKRGRPKTFYSPKVLHVTLEEDEHAGIMRKAQANGMKGSEFVRKLLIDALASA